MMIKILMLTGDAGEAQEIYYAKFRLEEEGWQVQIAAPEKRSSSRSSTTSSPVSTPTPRSRAIASRPTWGSTTSSPQEYQAWSCPVAVLPNICGTGREAVAIVRHSSSRQADRGELPRSAPDPRRRRGRGTDDDCLSRARARPPQRRGRVRQSGGGRRWPPGHGPRMARQRTMDEGIRSSRVRGVNESTRSGRGTDGPESRPPTDRRSGPRRSAGRPQTSGRPTLDS